MSLGAIVAALGGDLYHGGRRASVPAPGHSAADRSISLILNGDRVIAHGFGAADWREALRDLVERGLVDARGRLTSAGPVGRPPPLARGERMEVARRLWQEAGPIREGDLAARHLRLRGQDTPTRWMGLRFHPKAPLHVYAPIDRREARTRRALVAGVLSAAGDLVGVELTYLDPNGQRATGLRIPRKTVGRVPGGSAVHLCAPERRMLVGEGLFSVMAAVGRFDLPGWALLSAGNLARWTPPPGVERVLIAADRGAGGEDAAGRLCSTLRGLGVAAEVKLPPPFFGDWDEARPQGGRREEGTGGAPRRG